MERNKRKNQGQKKVALRRREREWTNRKETEKHKPWVAQISRGGEHAMVSIPGEKEIKFVKKQTGSGPTKGVFAKRTSAAERARKD